MADFLTSNTPRCKQLALWAWVVAGAGFLALMYASLGLVGPAPAFLTWTAFAAPLFLLTWRWWTKVGMSPRRRLGLTTLVGWSLLAVAIPVFETPTNQAPSPLQWGLMAALVLFPIGLTWQVIRIIHEHHPGSPGAA